MHKTGFVIYEHFFDIFKTMCTHMFVHIYIRPFSKLAELTAHCQIANDWTCFVDHKL